MFPRSSCCESSKLWFVLTKFLPAGLQTSFCWRIHVSERCLARAFCGKRQPVSVSAPSPFAFKPGNKLLTYSACSIMADMFWSWMMQMCTDCRTWTAATLDSVSPPFSARTIACYLLLHDGPSFFTQLVSCSIAGVGKKGTREGLDQTDQ